MNASATLSSSPTSSTFKRRGLSLSSRLALLVLTATLIVFAVVALAISDRAREVLTSTASSALKSGVTALKDNVQTWLDLSTKALQTLAKQPTIVNMDPQQQKPYLKAMLESFAEQTSPGQ